MERDTLTTAEPGARGWVLRLAEKLETTPITLGRWLLVLGAIIVLRHFLEQMSGQKKTLYFLSYFIHYPLAYVAPLLALAVLLSAFARERIERVTRLMLFAWLLTLLPPLIDLALPRAGDAPQLIGYLIPRTGGLWTAFVNLFNPTYGEFQGTTAGIRIEAAIGCVLGATYVHLKTRSAGRAVASFFAIYVTMFFFFALPPILLAITRFLGSDVENVYLLLFGKASVHRAFVNATPFGVSDLSNALVDLLVIAPVLALWYRLYDRERFVTLLRDIDAVQVAFHVALTLAGMALGARLLLGSRGLLAVSHPFDVVAIVGVLAAAAFASLTAGSLRRIHAPAGDPDAPADRDRAREIGVFYFAFATLFAVTVSYVALTYVLAFLAVYYLYYALPVRLCRFAGVAGFAVGGAALFSLSLGYSSYAGAAASLWLPRSAALLVVLVPTLALGARDLWDSGASRGERWNLVTMVGEPGARRLAGVGVLLGALIPGVALRLPLLLIPGAIVGALSFLVVTRSSGTVVPRRLSALAAALLVAAYFMGATGAPVLREEVATTGFAEASRRSGTFEMLDADAESEVDRALADGVSLFHRGDFDGAVEAFRRAVELEPDNASAHVSLGSAYLRLNRAAEAARAFRRGIDVDPDNASAHVGLAQGRKLSGDPDGAIVELERALELDPESVDALYTLALVHQDLGNTEEETAALESAVTLDPQLSQAQSRLADIYLSRRAYPEAVAALKAALVGRTPVGYVHTRLSEAYYSMGDYEQAESEIRKEIALSPRSAAAHATLAQLLVELGRKEEAREEYRLAISLTSDQRLRRAFEQMLAELEE
jgi:tetratricopeptide (TPR) repeat protein